ncbi:MAG: cobyric acid synthase CobQ, partial [Methyloceanibacter sp.]
LFADDRQRAAWLARFAPGGTAIAYDALVDDTLDTLAAHLAAHIDLDRLLKLAR